MVDMFIGLMIVVIIAIAAVFPIIQFHVDNITSMTYNQTVNGTLSVPAQITGTTATLLEIVPLLLIIAVIVIFVATIQKR